MITKRSYVFEWTRVVTEGAKKSLFRENILGRVNAKPIEISRQ